MKKNIILAFALIAMVSCDKNTTITIGTDTKIAAQFTNVTITRALNNAWEANDKIGVYMVAKDATLTDIGTLEDGKNIAHTVSVAGASGSFAPLLAETIYFPMDNSAVDFFAYYPFQADIVDGVSTVNVATQIPFSDIDILTSKVTNRTKFTPSVVFPFAHQMSMITMNISAGRGVETVDLIGLVVTIEGLPTTANFNLANNTFEDLANTANIVVATNPEGAISQAILIPSAAVTGANIRFKLTSNEEFNWSIADKSLISGDNVTYEVTINRTGVEILGSQISNWNHIVGESISAE